VVPPVEARVIDAELIGEPATIGKVVCCRGAHDGSGPMLGTIAALRAIREVAGDLPLNVIWAWEGEEEIGSPHLMQFIEAKVEDLKKACGVRNAKMRQDRAGVMQIYRGALARATSSCKSQVVRGVEVSTRKTCGPRTCRWSMPISLPRVCRHCRCGSGVLSSLRSNPRWPRSVCCWWRCSV
jgi:hypothetical protein